MADWRQIQARIRKAKAGADPLGALTELFEKTHDAMVAFELARWQEKSGQNGEAVRWYIAAAERFRRAEWKKKAEEALKRLAAAPMSAVETPAGTPPGEELFAQAVEPAALPPVSAPSEVSGPAEPGAGGKRRRRGRRGGRRHRRSKRAQATAGGAEAGTEVPLSAPAPSQPLAPPLQANEAEPAPISAAWQSRARAGEPGLASRIAGLESQLRRLIASPLYRAEDAKQAPAGPGVLLLSDSDQTTYYYVEACRTLRIAVDHLLRTGRGERREASLRARLAEHLGVSESSGLKYLKEHCAVRWLQLDEGAAQLAHFAIAVLRPSLNE